MVVITSIFPTYPLAIAMSQFRAYLLMALSVVAGAVVSDRVYTYADNQPDEQPSSSSAALNVEETPQG